MLWLNPRKWTRPQAQMACCKRETGLAADSCRPEIMLYLDASVLAKRYFTERGTDAVQTRFRSGERIFTSVLSYAEIHAALGRKYRARELKANDFEIGSASCRE